MDLSQLSLLNDKALNIPSLSSCYEMLILITQRNAVDNFQVKKKYAIRETSNFKLGQGVIETSCTFKNTYNQGNDTDVRVQNVPFLV